LYYPKNDAVPDVQDNDPNKAVPVSYNGCPLGNPDLVSNSALSASKSIGSNNSTVPQSNNFRHPINLKNVFQITLFIKNQR
jgi:hypothetical protein